VPLVVELFADEYAARFYPSMVSTDAAREWIDWSRRNYQRLGYGLWVVESIETGGAIGDCGLTVQEVAGEPMTEVGYHIVDAARRRGYATEAARACLAFALSDLGLAAVCSIVDPRNEASIGVAARIHSTRSEFVNQQGETMLLFTTHNHDP
jgi:RimJ/RimL family protein N-acetyltransferase